MIFADDYPVEYRAFVRNGARVSVLEGVSRFQRPSLTVVEEPVLGHADAAGDAGIAVRVLNLTELALPVPRMSDAGLQ